jgi:hypothetical protein
MFWRRKPVTHETIAPDFVTIAFRTSWVVAACGVFLWIWSQL